MLVMNMSAVGAGSLESPTDPKSRNNTDYTGHAGGAITGLLWGLAFLPRGNTTYGRKLKYWGMSLTLSWFILFTLLLFTTKVT